MDFEEVNYKNKSFIFCITLFKRHTIQSVTENTL